MSGQSLGRRILFLGHGLFADRVYRVLPFFEDLRPTLTKSGMKLSLSVYVSTMLYSCAMAFTFMFFMGVVVSLFLEVTLPIMILFGTSLGTFWAGIVFIILYTYPSIKGNTAGLRLDEELPYVISHMTVLVTAGVTPKAVLRSLAESKSEDKIIDIARSTIRDIDLLGCDLITALERTMERVPSKTLQEFLEGYMTTVKKGGDLKNYLQNQAKDLLSSKAIAARHFGETIEGVAEVFVILMVVFPLLLLIMFSVMTLIQTSLSGISVIMLMGLMTYVLIPIFGVVMLLFVDSIMPKGE